MNWRPTVALNDGLYVRKYMKLYIAFDDVSKEGYATSDKKDAAWAVTGHGNPLNGVPTLGEAFRDNYADDGNIRLIEIEINDV